jgi:hypothetical protein
MQRRQHRHCHHRVGQDGAIILERREEPDKPGAAVQDAVVDDWAVEIDERAVERADGAVDGGRAEDVERVAAVGLNRAAGINGDIAVDNAATRQKGVGVNREAVTKRINADQQVRERPAQQAEGSRANPIADGKDLAVIHGGAPTAQ